MKRVLTIASMVLIFLLTGLTRVKASAKEYIYPNQLSLGRGASFKFELYNGWDDTRTKVNTVKWTVEGAKAAGTKVDANGVLTIDPKETAEKIYVYGNKETQESDYSTATVILFDKTPAIATPEVFNYSSHDKNYLYAGDKGAYGHGVGFKAFYGTGYQKDVATEWKIIGATSKDTRVQTDYYSMCMGYLYIGDDEKADSIRLVATSVFDPTVSGYMDITIRQNSTITDLNVLIDESVLNAVVNNKVDVKEAMAAFKNAISTDNSCCHVDSLNTMLVHDGISIDAMQGYSGCFTNDGKFGLYISMDCNSGFFWPDSTDKLTIRLNGKKINPKDVRIYGSTNQDLSFEIDLTPYYNEKQIYILTFNRGPYAKKGTMAPIVQTSAFFTLPKCTFVASSPSDYHFAGWSFKEQGEIIKTDTIKLQPGTTVLYATWGKHAGDGTWVVYGEDSRYHCQHCVGHYDMPGGDPCGQVLKV